MFLSDAGLMAQSTWQDIPNHFAFIKLDTFSIMPDHMHGILILQKPDDLLANPDLSEKHNVYHEPIQIHYGGGITGMKNPMLHDNISRESRWFKGKCTFEIRKILPEFEWQRNFNDRIIRDDVEWNSIRRYIEENPENWDDIFL